MKNHKGDYKGFVHLSRAWYGDVSMRKSDYVDSVTFGFYSEDGGTSGEMSVQWEMLGRQVTPCLIVWNDAWHTLNEFSNVIAKMADIDDEHITPIGFCELLLSCGFRDDTKEEIPK